jgi:hypothetical protein
MDQELEAVSVYLRALRDKNVIFDIDMEKCSIFYIPKFPVLYHQLYYRDIIAIYVPDNEEQYGNDGLNSSDYEIYIWPYSEYKTVPECELRSYMSNYWGQQVFKYQPYYRISNKLFVRISKLKAFM